MDVKITGKTRLTGLLGSPVSHSLSPAMHNRAFQFLRLDYVYLCFDVVEKDLRTAVEGLKICGIRGFNCTMPDKNRMLELTDSCSKAAEMIGAVNTVLNEGGILTGYKQPKTVLSRAVKLSPFWEPAVPPPPSPYRLHWTESVILPSPQGREAVFITEPCPCWIPFPGTPDARRN